MTFAARPGSRVPSKTNIADLPTRRKRITFDTSSAGPFRNVRFLHQIVTKAIREAKGGLPIHRPAVRGKPTCTETLTQKELTQRPPTPKKGEPFRTFDQITYHDGAESATWLPNTRNPSDRNQVRRWDYGNPIRSRSGQKQYHRGCKNEDDGPQEFHNRRLRRENNLRLISPTIRNQ